MPVVPIINFTGGEVSSYLYGRIDTEMYQSSCKYMENFIPTQYGAARRRSGFRYVASGRVDNTNGTIRLIPYIYSASIAYVLEFSNSRMRVYYDGAIVLNDNGTVYELPTSYTDDIVRDLQYAQYGDRLIIVHPSYPPYELQRGGSVVTWTLTRMTFNHPEIDAGAAMTIDYAYRPLDADATAPEINTTYFYTFTVVYEDGTEAILDDNIYQPWPVDGAAVIDVENVIDIGASINTLQSGVDLTQIAYLKFYRSSVSVSAGRGTLSYGSWGFIGRGEGEIISEITGNRYIANLTDDGTRIPDYTQSIPEYNVDFASPEFYPRTVTFDQNRLVFGGSSKEPYTIYGSKINSYNNFAEYDAPLATHAYEYQLVSQQVNEINWIRSASRLLVGTVGNEWRGSDIRPDQPPNTRAVSWIGSKYLQSLAVEDATFFADRSGRAVRNFRFDYRVNDFVSQNISMYAEHLFRDRSVVEWAYASDPDSIVYCVCDDGTMLGVVVNIEQSVIAWFRITTQFGKFMSVASIPEGDRDALYAVVTREFPCEETQYYIERLEPNFVGNDVTEAFFVDGGVTIENPAGSIQFDGLGHLEGQLVSVLADGGVRAPVTVTNGTITLDYPAKKVTIGLPIHSELQTFEIEGGGYGLTSQSVKRRAASVVVRYDESVGGLIGMYPEFLSEIVMRETTMRIDIAIPPQTGLSREITIESSPEDDLTLYVKQDAPLPFTVVALYPRVTEHGG